MQLLGVTITDVSRKEILTRVKVFLAEPKFHRIATVNPEFLVLADRDSTFKQSLLSADLCVADGIGIVLAGWLQGKHITRFAGADLLHEILLIAEGEHHSVFLAIKKDGLSSYEEIRAALVKQYPKIILNGADIDLSLNQESRIKNHDSQFSIHDSVVICNLGAPEQEIFLESLRNNPGNTRLAMGVGGAFDFLTGKQKRAPRCLRTIGLEWLWRLVIQPRRFKRIWTAVVVFPLKVLLRSRTSQ